MTEYTRAERATINAAYERIAYFAETHNHGAPGELKSALDHERRQRSNVTVAKALMVDLFAKGYHDEFNHLWVPTGQTIADLYAISPGLRFAQIYGAVTYRRCRDSFVDRPADTRLRTDCLEFVGAAVRCAAAFEAARVRGSAEIERQWRESQYPSQA